MTGGVPEGAPPVGMLGRCVAPRAFRAPEGPAAREARRPHFVRRRASKPARALRTLRRPPHQWGPVADRCVVSLSGHAPPPPTGTAARPAASCGRHGGLACLVFGVLGCVLLRTSSIQGVFRVDFCPVVTNVVNPRAFSLKMVVFGLRLTTFVTGVFVRRFESCWFDDVCNVGCPLVARPGPASAHGHRSLALSARPLACLKPLSPLRAPAKPRLKPPSPLRVRNGCFWCSFRVQW